METAKTSTPPMPAKERSMADKPPRQRGETYIDDEVVAVIARIAAEQIPGVHKIGESSLRQIMSRLGRSHGVEAEVGLQEAAVDVEIVVEFGYSIRQIAEEMRERIIQTVESMTGRKVVEVNIFVVDVHVPKPERKQRRKLE
jgi:uncharacterized alkaline shock family protein YloU